MSSTNNLPPFNQPNRTFHVHVPQRPPTLEKVFACRHCRRDLERCPECRQSGPIEDVMVRHWHAGNCDTHGPFVIRMPDSHVTMPVEPVRLSAASAARITAWIFFAFMVGIFAGLAIFPFLRFSFSH